MFILLDGVAIAQEENVSEEITQREVYNDVKEYMSQLAEGIGETVEHVYPIIVKQQVISGSVRLSIVLLLTVLTIVLHKNYASLTKTLHDVSVDYNNKARSSDNYYEVVTGLRDARADISGKVDTIVVAFFVSAAITFLTAFCWLTTSIGKVFNPEYAAIKDIVEFIGR